MIKISPNPNMSIDEARKFLLDFLSRPNDGAEELSIDTLQKVVDSVLSIKKLTEGERGYDRISSVDFVGKNNGDISLGANEVGIAKNDKIYISDVHIWQDSYRFSLVSLLFHESTHNIQHFKLDDLSRSVDVPLKPEPKNPANLSGFKCEILNFVRDNYPDGLCSILHMFESDYYGQARELEAYKMQYRYMTSILADLKPIMSRDSESILTYDSYKKMQEKYFPLKHETRHEKNDGLWKHGREIMSKYMYKKIEDLQANSGNLADDRVKRLYTNDVSNVIAGLHFNYDKEILKSLAPLLYNMPENTFDDMSNKAMAMNSLVTSTLMGYSKNLMSELYRLFETLSSHPDNGKVVNGHKNICYSIEKFYEDYRYLGQSSLKDIVSDISHSSI